MNAFLQLQIQALQEFTSDGLGISGILKYILRDRNSYTEVTRHSAIQWPEPPRTERGEATRRHFKKDW